MSELDLNPVSVTQGDRVLTGVGADPDKLAETMERHAPEGVETVQPPAETPPEEKPVTRGNKRFAQLTSERDKEKNAREAAERERDELKARLAAAPAVAEPMRQPVSDRSELDARETRPEEPDFERDYESKIGEKFQTYGAAIQAFQRDHVKWTLHAENFDAKIRSSIEADRASRTQAEHVTKAVDRGRKAYQDFDAVLNSPHMTATTWPAEKIQAIAALEEPEHIQYALGKDPALAERLRTANPVQFGMELAKLIPAPAVARLASTAGAGTVTPPPPFQPVGAGSKTTAPPLAELTKKGGFDYDQSGYRERRAAELGRGTRRR